MERQVFNPMQYFLRWQEDRLSQTEAQQLRSWLAESEENREAWERLKKTWRASEHPAIPDGTPQETQWQRFLNRIEKVEYTPERHPQTSSILDWVGNLNLPLRRLAVTAVALALVFLAIQFRAKFLGSELKTLSVPNGQRHQLVLADGSRVNLNAGATLRYPRTFDSNARQVRLQGEGYFDVIPSGPPFVVETEESTITVSGTEFDVQAREYKTVVFVKQGRVQVTSKNAEQVEPLLIVEGEVATIDAKSVHKNVAKDPEEILAWREGRLVLHRRPLAEVLAEIQRFYNITIEADSSLLHHTVTASFRQEPPSQIVEALALAVNARASRQGNHYLLLP
jgi:transmembrane sensor